MKTSPSGASARPHFSHSFFISSAIGSDDCRQIPRNWNAQNEFNHHARTEDVDFRFRYLPQFAENFPSKATTAKLVNNALVQDRFAQRNFYSLRHFGSRGGGRRGTGGITQVALGTGNGETLRDRDARWRSFDSTAAGRCLSGGSLSKATFASDQTGRAKGFRFCSAVAASASWHKDRIS